MAPEALSRPEPKCCGHRGFFLTLQGTEMMQAGTRRAKRHSPELRDAPICDKLRGSFPRPPSHCDEPDKFCRWNRGGGTIASLVSFIVRFGFTSVNGTSCNDSMLFSCAATRQSQPVPPLKLSSSYPTVGFDKFAKKRLSLGECVSDWWNERHTPRMRDIGKRWWFA